MAVSTIKQSMAINDQNIKLSTSTPIVITPTTGCSAYAPWGGCYYYKIGTRVAVHIGVSGLTANTYVSNIGVLLPAGFRPRWETHVFGSSGTSVGYSRVTIFPGGTIGIVSTGVYGLIDVSYDAFG